MLGEWCHRSNLKTLTNDESPAVDLIDMIGYNVKASLNSGVDGQMAVDIAFLS
jgi:hypothetical protein